MITTKEVKIKIPLEPLTSNYIELQLMNMGLDVLRWAITDYNEEFFNINVSIIE